MSLHEQVHVTGHDLHRHHSPAALAGLRADQLRSPARHPDAEDHAAALRAPHHVIPEIADATCGNLHLPGHACDSKHPLRQNTRFPRRPKTAIPSRGT